MNVVLFGAGASVDQAGPGQPPLTSQLYRELKTYFPETWGNLPPHLENIFKNDQRFEAGTTKIIDEAFPTIPGGFRADFTTEEFKRWRNLQWDLAKFFFSFKKPTPEGKNLYDVFLDTCSVSDLLSLRVATLNYDRLLQVSAGSRHIGICYSGTPNMAEPLALCLPHGASYLVPPKRGASEIVPSGKMLTHDGPLLDLTVLDDLQAHCNGTFPPAMSYVDPNKAAASGLSFLKRQQAVWINWAQKAARVALVGVSVRNPDAPDAHLWEPLRTTKAQILHVSKSEEHAKAFEKWSADSKRAKDTPIAKTWAEAFDEVIEFLRPRQT